MPDTPVYVLAFWNAAPGHEQALEEVLLALVEPSRAEEGYLRYELYASRDGSGRFTFVEEWASEAALEAHRHADHLRVARERGIGLVGEAPRVEICRLVR
jgi:quinol monooxygenase YgiN